VKQLILLTSFLLGCGFPVFLIGFYSVKIWESHLRSYSLSFADLDSSVARPSPSIKCPTTPQGQEKDQRKEVGGDRPGREKSPSPISSKKRVVIRSILGPTTTSVDVLSPSRQTISLSVEWVPPPTTSNVVSLLGKGRTDPAASVPDCGQTDPAAAVPDCGQTPLPIPDSAASARKRLEVLRGLTESDFKYGRQAAILENQQSAITPELMAGSSQSFYHRYI
jgi:hypothetical protein